MHFTYSLSYSTDLENEMFLVLMTFKFFVCVPCNDASLLGRHASGRALCKHARDLSFLMIDRHHSICVAETMLLLDTKTV